MSRNNADNPRRLRSELPKSLAGGKASVPVPSDDVVDARRSCSSNRTRDEDARPTAPASWRIARNPSGAVTITPKIRQSVLAHAGKRRTWAKRDTHLAEGAALAQPVRD